MGKIVTLLTPFDNLFKEKNWHFRGNIENFWSCFLVQKHSFLSLASVCTGNVLILISMEFFPQIIPTAKVTQMRQLFLLENNFFSKGVECREESNECICDTAFKGNLYVHQTCSLLFINVVWTVDETRKDQTEFYIWYSNYFITNLKIGNNINFLCVANSRAFETYFKFFVRNLLLHIK